MNVALKEWSLVCDLLVQGEQIALLRKGGIHEPHRGAFALEHDAFLLYPNAEHQSPEQVRDRYRERLASSHAIPREDGEVVILGFCRVTDVLPLNDPDRVRALESHTCWSQPFFDMRLAYKPERPLHLVLVRAFRFPQPLRVPYHKAYAGCRSWVPLKEGAPDDVLGSAVPALTEDEFNIQRRAILEAVGEAAVALR